MVSKNKSIMFILALFAGTSAIAQTTIHSAMLDGSSCQVRRSEDFMEHKWDAAVVIKSRPQDTGFKSWFGYGAPIMKRNTYCVSYFPKAGASDRSDNDRASAFASHCQMIIDAAILNDKSVSIDGNCVISLVP